VFSSLGGGLPTSNGAVNGRTLQSNTVMQYRFGRYFTPELEVNSTRYFGGTRDGKTQTFLTPGIVMGKFCDSAGEREEPDGDCGGRGVPRLAVTSYHSYNHALVMSLRLAF